MTNKPVMLVALVTALGIGAWLGGSREAGAQNGGVAPTKVAVVDLQEIIANSAQQAKYRADNQAKGAELQAEQKKRQDAIATLTKDLDPLAPGSDAWMQKRDELQQKTLEMRVWVEMQEQNQQLEQARQFATLYEAANTASGEVGKSMGFDIVLQGGDLPNLMQLNIQQLQSVVQSRKVLYSADSVDVTQAVLQKVNTAFNQR